MLTVQEVTDKDQWNQLIEAWQGHPLQSWQWGDLRAATGPWTAHRILCIEAGTPVGGAQILVRRLPWPFRAICYAPRGPWAADPSRLGQIADACAAWCREHTKAVSLKIDPPATALRLGTGWVTGDKVLMATTAIVDLQPDEDAILKSLHSRNARYYIRRGARDGITVEPGTADDLEAVIGMYQETAARDGFPLHPADFYRQAFALLGSVGQLSVAKHSGKAVSFMWNVTTSWGASELWAGATQDGRRSRANYALKWGAMKMAKAVGARRYDMNGLLNDGISEFKRSFQHEPTVWAGTFDKPLRAWYRPWTMALGLYQSCRHLVHRPRQRAVNE